MNENSLNLLDAGIWFFLILSFLVGYLIAYFISRAKVVNFTKNADALQSKFQVQEEQLKKTEEDLLRHKAQLRELDETIKILDAEHQRGKQSILELQTQVDKAKASEKSYTQTIESLHQQILQLHQDNENLEHTLSNTDRTAEQLTELQTLFNASKKKIDWLEERLQRLEPQTGTPVKQDKQPLDAPVIPEEPKLSTSPDPSLLSEKIVPDTFPKDDFTLIEGIGPFIQNKLYEQKIYAYDQLASLNGPQIRDLARAIRFLPDRIEADNWTGQAAKLAALKLQNPEHFSASQRKKPDPDDLSIIGGITPQLESILQEAGIQNWQILADAEIADLQRILDMAGENYREADPSSWPAQAKLALSGQWDLLEEFKRELSER